MPLDLNDPLTQVLLNESQRKGHFALRHNRHTNIKFFCEHLFHKRLDEAQKICRVLAQKISKALKENGIKRLNGVVVVGGAKLAGYEFTQQLRRLEYNPSSLILTMRDPETEKLVLETGFEIKKSGIYLIFEDVVTTGESVRETISLVRKYNGEVTGLAYLIDRSGRKAQFDLPICEFLAAPEVEQWFPDECPLCKRIPLDKI